jgi:hypothetical protein
MKTKLSAFLKSLRVVRELRHLAGGLPKPVKRIIRAAFPSEHPPPIPAIGIEQVAVPQPPPEPPEVPIEARWIYRRLTADAHTLQ